MDKCKIESTYRNIEITLKRQQTWSVLRRYACLQCRIVGRCADKSQ